jgi:hypothetical protein
MNGLTKCDLFILISQGSPKKQTQWDIIEIYYKILAHMTMEAEKSHDLMCASWDPGKLVV